MFYDPQNVWKVEKQPKTLLQLCSNVTEKNYFDSWNIER